MLEQGYIGSVCEIKTLKNVFILSGRIINISLGEIEISDPAGPLPLISYKTPVKIAIFNSTLGFRMMAGQIYASTRKVIRIIDVLDFLDYERRKFFRVDIDTAAELLVKGEDEKVIVQEIPIRIKNLSLCGMMFEVEHDLAGQEGKNLEVRVPLHKNKVEIIPLVLHRNMSNDEKYRYGVEFTEVNKHVEQNLCAYLFDQQRKQIQKSRSTE